MENNLSFEDLVEQFLDCCRNGSCPDIDDFANSYPAHKDELLEILPLLQDLEEIGNKKQYDSENTISVSVPNLLNPDYRLLGTIGAGGMGVVFEALQLSLDRKVAIKILSKKLITDVKQREQFEKEAKIIAMLHHPNIVKVYSAGCSPDCCYYAMELIEGQGLNQCKIYDIKQIAKIALQTARAVSYAHSCKCLHRDIKPANILLDNNGQVHISDFGLAFLLSDRKQIQSMDLKSGTLRYAAPEKLLTGRNNFLTDQYSFGVTFYEVVTKSPFLTAINSAELAEKIKKGKLPKLTCEEKGFSAIINKCMAYNPDNRYRTMDEVAADLERFLNNEPVHAAKYTPVERFNLWKRRQPAAALFSLISAICAVLFVAALITGFIQTNAALELARKNADTADATLSKVFSYIEKQTPSASGSVLLDTLLPYYQEIAKQKSAPKEKIIQANRIVGLYAMHSGNYPLAEKSYRKLTEFLKDAHSDNLLAEALEKQNKLPEAVSIRNEVVRKYSNSRNAADRYEAVRALLALSGEGNTDKAFEMIKLLLEAEPSNKDYLFVYALTLGGNPKKYSKVHVAGIQPDAVVILNNLAKDYPDNPMYGIALVELMTRKLRYAGHFSARDWENLDIAFDTADKLLAVFPNTPDAATSVVGLKMAYIRYLRQSGDMVKSRKETEQLLGMLELLFYGSETPASVQESLIDLQLDRLGLFVRDGRSRSAAAMKQKLRKELNYYKGARFQEFQNRFNNLLYDSPSVSPRSRYARQ